MIAWRQQRPVGGKLAGTLLLYGFALALDASAFGAQAASCPVGAIAVAPGASIQSAVDLSGDGALFCLRSGIHRAQSIQPRPGQQFYGEDGTVLNGSRIITDVARDGRYWVAPSEFRRGGQHGECMARAPACNRPEALFLDDKPLNRVLSKEALSSGTFYIDYEGARIYLFDDPTNRKLEATATPFAFESAASEVWISNVTVEKFASAAQKGAIHAREGARWRIEDCVVRLNSGAGISVGTGSRVHNCDVHHNGQIGIEGNGTDIRIEQSRIWLNNIYGFDPAWEAGGVKIAESDGVVFRRNHVHHNDGPGLWCDIDCRNVLYEENLVEDNTDIGIFHEISFKALIRGNVVRHNGGANRSWFWGADITIAASQDVEVTDNRLVVASGGCGIMLIDQGRRGEDGTIYKTRNNSVHGNDMRFEAGLCAGGTADTEPGSENFSIITDGNNWFDRNTYRVHDSGTRPRLVWGRDIVDWDGFRQSGMERQGTLLVY
jgi:hypothetical protein